MLAYPMSRKSFKYRNVLSFFVFFTMLFNGGIVPAYIMWTQIFHIKNTIFALLIPNYLVNAFNVILVKNYYSNNVPDALLEAAQIDGASEMTIFRRIMLPLAVPAIATISLFTGLCYWNDWTNGLYYISNEKLYSIQMLLMNIMNNIQALRANSTASLLGTGVVDLPGTAIRMAMAVIGILPILLVYPFVQKHLVRGVVAVSYTHLVADFMKAANYISREHTRTPMHWDDSPHAGFTTGTPWIPLNPNYPQINAAKQVGDPESVYSFYRRLLALRKSDKTFVYGHYALLLPDDEEIYAYTRTLNDEQILVVCNFTDHDVPCPLLNNWQNTELLISNYNTPGNPGSLRPFEAVVYRK